MIKNVTILHEDEMMALESTMCSLACNIKQIDDNYFKNEIIRFYNAIAKMFEFTEIVE